MDVRRRHVESRLSAEKVEDIVTFLLADYSFMSRRHLSYISKVWCLIAERPSVDLLEIIIELDGWAVSASVVTPCLMGVQRLWSSASYKQGAFFTEGTMESVRESIACSREFMASSAFDPGEDISRTDRTEFVTRHTVAFDHYLARKKKECVTLTGRLVMCNLALAAARLLLGLEICQGRLYCPKSSFGFASTVALSKECGSSGSSRKGTKSPDTSLSVLMNQGKTDERAEKDTTRALWRSGRESGKGSGRGKNSGKGHSSRFKKWFKLNLWTIVKLVSIFLFVVISIRIVV